MGGLMSVDVKKIRQGLNLSQVQFAERFGFMLHTVQNWEQGLRSPSGPARVLLMVIAQAPDVVLTVIESSKIVRIIREEHREKRRQRYLSH